ncbi:cytochrome c oxidase subunit II [bacterium]|nr:cytochrome c oxidase subunit II [bacterium]
MFRYLPEQASKVAPSVDWLHNWITDLSVLFTVAICGAMLYFAFRYRRQDGVDHETPRIEGSNFLEVLWTVVPTLICIWVGYYGIVIYQDMREGEEQALVINAVGKQWIWEFQYENGKQTIGEFVVPVNRPVKVVLTATDVLHSFFVPAMRVKKDAVPGRYTSVVFTPVKTGEYHTFCTEYCGTSHSAMLAKLRVVSESEYERWVNDRSQDLAKLTMSPAKLGARLYEEKGCNACHNLSGTRLVGPSFLKLYQSETRKFADGSEITFGEEEETIEEYIRESILYPGKKVVEGYPNGLMPAYEGQLTDDEIKALIAFIKQQDGSAATEESEEDSGEDLQAKLAAMSPVERGQYHYQNKACIGCHSLDGSNLVGPTFKGLYGKSGELADGESYTADDEYLKNSIWDPNGQIVAGYQPNQMPQNYKDQLSEEDLESIIEYIKTLE